MDPSRRILYVSAKLEPQPRVKAYISVSRNSAPSMPPKIAGGPQESSNMMRNPANPVPAADPQARQELWLGDGLPVSCAGWELHRRGTRRHINSITRKDSGFGV